MNNSNAFVAADLARLRWVRHWYTLSFSLRPRVVTLTASPAILHHAHIRVTNSAMRSVADKLARYFFLLAIPKGTPDLQANEDISRARFRRLQFLNLSGNRTWFVIHNCLVLLRNIEGLFGSCSCHCVECLQSGDVRSGKSMEIDDR